MTAAGNGQAATAGLAPADLEGLSTSYITAELAAQAQIRRVPSTEAAEILARKDTGLLAGLVFPYFRPSDEVSSHLERVRLDSPPLISKNGVTKSGQKYLTAHGSRNRLYFMPGTHPALLSDTSVDIVITEGEKKCIALHRLACEGYEQLRYLPVGLAGVYGWTGQTGIATNAKGVRFPVKGPIPDLDWINFDGRRVTILFDSNAATKVSVNFARLALASELKQRGATVYIADLPECNGVNGIDDYLHLHGAQPGMSVIEAARIYSPKERLAAIDFTDAGNEEAFELLYREDFLYNATAKEWLEWDGNYWVPDSAGKTDRAMLEVANARLQAVSALKDNPDEYPLSVRASLSETKSSDARACRKAAFRQALRLRNIHGRDAAIRSAQSNPSFVRRAEDFDQNDLLFACRNGVIELETGTFRPGRREDLITLHSEIDWEPGAAYDGWVSFLNELFPGHPDMIPFLKRAVGYSLTGLTREEVFFILHGAGRNGKGTLLRVISAVLGGYAATTEFSTLTAHDRLGGPRNDIAALAGRRFVTAQESKEGTRLDEPLIKTLTGGDLITARFLHKEFFTFKPTWKIWLATNHRPEIRGDDTGIWSRPKLLPFEVSFEGKENRSLKDKLLDPIQLSGVLRWGVEGCVEYLSKGLEYPKEVIEATSTYRAESDVVARFIEERCIVGKNETAERGRLLYAAFSQWAKGAGEEPITETAFGRRMAKRFKKKPHKWGVEYVGVGLKPSDYQESPSEDCPEDSPE